MQWGFNYEVKSNNPFNLPISYSEAIFCVVATAADWTATGAWWYKNGATLNKIAIGIGADDTPASGNFTYLAIGVQQWGYSATTNTTITLPISFSNTNYSITATAATSGARGGMKIYSKTVSNFFMCGADGSSVFNWASCYIAIGN